METKVNTYGEAAIEVLDILNHMKYEDIRKIPKDFINFLKSIADVNYQVNLDHSKPIYELDITDKAKDILSLIYITWWSSPEERQRYKATLNSDNFTEQKYKTREDMFKKTNAISREQEQEQVMSMEMVEYKKQGIIKRIIDKIKNFFKFQ